MNNSTEGLNNSNDLIERQAAIDAIRASTSKYTGFMEMEMYTDDDAVEAIEGVPSAQPEIVRCRECKYWREHKYAKETKRYIPFCGFNAIYTKADDYCSYAERRTDERTD